MDAIRQCSLSVACLALMAVPVVGQDEMAIPVAQTSASEKFQVVLLQSNLVMNGSFAFGEGMGTIPEMTTGTFGAELEGQVVMGQFANLSFGLESIWMAHAANEQISVLASGLKSQGFLFGQASILVDGIPVNTFWVVGQEAPIETIPQDAVAAPTSPAALPSPLSAQPDTGPLAPDARPSIFNR
jgi:hypothetical protein